VRAPADKKSQIAGTTRSIFRKSVKRGSQAVQVTL